MTKQELTEQILRKQSYLCIGLDTDLNKIPSHLRHEKYPLVAFNKQIIDATAEYTIAYKLNTAFYEAQGAKGWESMQRTLELIPKNILTIADAKRGDIGNTCDMYAQAFFEALTFDAITLSPYMGKDSLEPFLKYENKWLILLVLTSNESSIDFQFLPLQNGNLLYEQVLTQAQKWANFERLMFVVGATQSESIAKVRKLAPLNFLLIPGIGTQGGDLEAVSKHGFNADIGILVNVSRAVIYASKDKTFAQTAKKEAQNLQALMQNYLEKYYFTHYSV
ncbi:MAG: orotidine-5'-phosphate decarboxylase [Microscillaceae bacterium]|nr:orotidine-5'-phosphate decarboxylase [Microscillaceae bacterium]MDW8459727.1 orotidine-5'-phosphate decarboxylase [Cytophagales bacterium]